MNLTTGGKVNILIVDDRPEGLMALEAVLQNSEYRLVKASSGEDALRKILDEDFALILLDVQMPGMNGFETAEVIRERPRSRDVPIIFVTAISKDEQFVGRGYEVGAVDYLFKPINPAVLRSKVSVFVDLHRKAQQIQLQAEMLRLSERRERERQIAELRTESTRKYQNLADALPNVFWKANVPGSVDYFNKVWTQFTGLTLDESIGAGWVHCVHEEDRNQFLERWWSADAAQEDFFEVEARVLEAKKTEWRWHLIRGLVEKDRSGRKTGWLGTFTEIHERKEAEQERMRILKRESQARIEAEEQALRFSQLTQLMPQLVWEFRDTGELWLNQRCVEYTGVPAEELHKARFSTVIHSDDYGVSLMLWKKAVADKAPFSTQCRLRRKDGQYRWFMIKGNPVRNPKGGFRWVGLATDIQEFYDQNNQRARFLSVASHELKTPLTSIRTTLQIQLKSMQLERTIDNTQMQRLLDIGFRSTDRLANLIDDLLDHSRVESGQLVIESKRSCLAKAVHEAVNSSAGAAEATGRLKIVADVPDQLEGVWDCVRLRQVIDNLIGNAIKYSPDGGQICVALRSERDEAVLSVSDQGIGIDADDQARIFHAFERAVPHSDFAGLGIGLYVSSRIVAQHQGTLEVTSEKGKGSTFIVRLPRWTKSGTSQMGLTQNVSQPAFGGDEPFQATL